MSPFSLSRREVISAGSVAAAAFAVNRSLPAWAQAPRALAPITKPIPSTGERLPVIGLGTNAYSANSAEQMAPLSEVLEHMPKVGGTLIDTARVYGRSEAVIGELLEALGNRAQMFIATKTPMFGDFSNPQAVLDVSFNALRVKTIDLIQIHMMAGLTQLMPVFESNKAAKRVRYIGISTSEDSQYDAIMAAMRQYPLDFIQVDYSLGNRAAADKVLPAALAKRVGVLINTPFGGRRDGNLFSRVGGRDLPESAEQLEVSSWGQLFLKYVVSHPAVTAAIPGMTRVSHLEENLAALRGRMPDAAMRARIEKYWDQNFDG